ncbi:hypothetical protein R3P38DRAFT_3519032 [Favolaschia claudopus]|uniref:Uncharacterized protein n=1 Tax=Favolaschia claudopus TaxID=2862362 RepID=A0AAW0BRG7_9AGAR
MDDNTCTDINKCRTLSDIMWPCLTTVFACIWVSVHPNMPPRQLEIPPPEDESVLSLGPWRHYWCGRMLDATSVIRQRLKMMLVALIAPEIMVGFAAQHGVSLTHGFLYSMGGFVDAEGYCITNEKQLTPSILAAIKAIPHADIQDRSKSDGLAKLVAITQILQIVAQSLARWDQHLATTSLEIATVAYAVVTTFMWFFWMNKPFDIHIPIQIGDKTSIQNDDSEEAGFFVSAVDQWGHAVARFQGMLSGHYPQSHFKFGTTKLKNLPAFFYYPPTHNIQQIAFRIEGAVAIAFGAIHCIAWNTEFSSTAEKWMWCLSAVAVTGVPAVWFIGSVAVHYLNIRSMVPYYAFVVPVVPLYIISRLFLLVLPLTALRSLEPAVFIDISWAKYIPQL